MNQLVTTPKYNDKLPAFMRKPEYFNEADKTTAGIGGSQPPYISIKGSKFALVSGDETLYVQQMHVDVIVLTGNPSVSKRYYAGAYDPAAEAKPPTCFSDNGIGPSYMASTPQHVNCAGCQFNAWGSKVTPTGSQVKACTDSKKLAVVLATDTPYLTPTNAAGSAPKMDEIYLLNVPAASMRTWVAYAKDIIGKGVPLIGVLTRITFDPKASYPSLMFAPVGFIQSEADFNEMTALVNDSAVIEAVGANDRPTAAAPVQAPLGAPPAHLAPPPVVAAPVQAAPAPVTEPAQRRRGRPAAAAPAAAPALAAAAPVPFAPLAATPAAPAGGAIQTPAASDPSLDALLAEALA